MARCRRIDTRRTRADGKIIGANNSDRRRWGWIRQQANRAERRAAKMEIRGIRRRKSVSKWNGEVKYRK